MNTEEVFLAESKKFIFLASQKAGGEHSTMVIHAVIYRLNSTPSQAKSVLHAFVRMVSIYYKKYIKYILIVINIYSNIYG